MAAPQTPTDKQFNQYAKAFADTAFADKKALNGQLLLTALPEKQVNLLVLYRLKEQWEREAEEIRSRFFDYDAPAVKEAQKKFLNTLSQHISLERETYEGLLLQALKDAWQLASSPVSFIVSLTETVAKPDLSVAQVQGIGKYFVYHAELLRQALRDLEMTGRSNFLKGDLHRQLQQVEFRAAAGAKEQTTAGLQQFLSTVTLEVEPEPIPEPEETSFFDSFEAPAEEPVPVVYSAPEQSHSYTSQVEQETANVQDATPWPEAPQVEVAESDQGLVVEPQPVVMPASVHESVDIQQPVEEVAIEEEQPVSLLAEEPVNFQLEPVWEAPPVSTEIPMVEQPEAGFHRAWTHELAPDPASTGQIKPGEEQGESLAERLARQTQGQGQALYTKVSSGASENLHSLIAIGDRYMMVGQLFGGDMASYSLAISHVNGLTSLEKALHYLWDEVAPKYGWNPESDAYKTLDSALRRKFAA